VVNAPGNYQTIMALGCDTAVILYTIDYSSITVDVVEDNFSIALGDSVLLQAIVVNSHLQTLVSWIDPESGSVRCPTCEETVARPFNDLRYTILVQNEKGCQDSAFVQVRVKKNISLYFPNVFTPDGGDQVNSYFYGFGDQYGVAKSFAIFSRWGELMFEAKGIPLNAPLAGWDGTWNGKAAPPGVYVWTATVVFLDGHEVKLAGDVTLIR
jgi:gliding motility-associated-like protein